MRSRGAPRSRAPNAGPASRPEGRSSGVAGRTSTRARPQPPRGMYGARTDTTLGESLVTTLDWRLIGPHRGGRVVAVAGDVSDRLTFYFGACAGGVWKTTDGGLPGAMSPTATSRPRRRGDRRSESDPNVIYAGQARRRSVQSGISWGWGLQSTDGGRPGVMSD